MIVVKLLASFLIFGFTFAYPYQVNAQTLNSMPSLTSTPAAGQVNSFELFWPISAGRVMGDPLYFLKSLKETLREILIFSDVKKAEYNMTLSEKRLVEAENLFMIKKNYQNGKLSLEAAQEKREKAISLLGKTKEKGRNITYVKNAVISSFERQRALLNYITTQIPEEQRSIIEGNVSKLNSSLSTLQ